jgi:hypothetical protein
VDKNCNSLEEVKNCISLEEVKNFTLGRIQLREVHVKTRYHKRYASTELGKTVEVLSFGNLSPTKGLQGKRLGLGKISSPA